MKEFVLPRDGDGDLGVLKFLVCETQLNLSLVFQDYLAYGFLVKFNISVFLGYLLFNQLQVFRKYLSFLNLSIA